MSYLLNPGKIKSLPHFILIFFIGVIPAGYAQVSINQRALDSLTAQAAATQSDALLIYHDGKMVYENYFGHSPRPIEAMSATKSIVNLAIGKLLTDGKISSVDQPVSDFYPEWKQGQKKQITIRHLLNHSSGIQNHANTSVEIYPSRDFIQLALAAELSNEPGTAFSYNNKAVNLLAGIVARASGLKLDRYLKEKIFKPLGIKNFKWAHDRAGNPHGMSGLQILPADLSRLGQFCLQKGNWDGRQIIKAEWFDISLQPNKLNETAGLLWWIEFAEVKAIIDDAQLNKLQAAGVDQAGLKILSTLKGEYTLEEYYKKFDELISKPYPDLMKKYTALLIKNNLSVSRRAYHQPIGYSARGYLGNYLAIYPDKKLVVVRMISDKNFASGPNGNKDGSGKNNFFEFFEMAKRLVY